MHGARALVAVSKGREGGLWSWVNGLLARRPIKDPRPKGRGISEQRELALLVQLPVA